MRLIDADALMKTLGITDMDCEKCALRNKTYPVCNRGDGFADACSAIEDAPTIEERKKGEWKLEEDILSMEGTFDGYFCSECGHGFLDDLCCNNGADWVDVEKDFKFCPFCGADMRGEDDGR